jgi:ribosomal protein L12E/L44/L45/RPP1/RPP2
LWFRLIEFHINVILVEQLSGRLLDETQVRAVSDEIKNVIIASATRKRDRTERTKAEDFDADEGELLKEENEQEEEVFDQVFCCEMIFWGLTVLLWELFQKYCVLQVMLNNLPIVLI